MKIPHKTCEIAHAMLVSIVSPAQPSAAVLHFETLPDEFKTNRAEILRQLQAAYFAFAESLLRAT